MKKSDNESAYAKMLGIVKTILNGLILSIFISIPVILILGGINAIFGLDGPIVINGVRRPGLGSDFGLVLGFALFLAILGSVLALIRYPAVIWAWLKPRPIVKWGLVVLLLICGSGSVYLTFRNTPAEKLAIALNGNDLWAIRAILEDNDFDQRYLDLQLEGAIQDGRFDAASALVEAGANVDQLDNSVGFTLLETAVLFDDLVTILFLIDQGADLSQTNSLGDTPMMTLIEFRLSKENMSQAEGAEIVQAMLAAGADPSHQNDFGQTAKDYAEQKNYGEILAVLP